MKSDTFKGPIFKVFIKRIIVPQIGIFKKKLFMYVFNACCNSDPRFIDNGKPQAQIQTAIPL